MRDSPDPASGPPPETPPAEWGVQLGRLPAAGSPASHAVAARCARVLEVPLREARLLLQRPAPLLLPRAFTEAEAQRVAAHLERDGAATRAKLHPHAGTAPCDAHPTLLNDGACAGCSAWICAVCRVQADGEPRCARCRPRAHRGRRLRRVRVALLLCALAGVALWAWSTERRRAARTEWARTLRVGVFVLSDAALADDDLGALEARLPDLARTLGAEFDRYRPGGPEAPFAFTPYGPVSLRAPPPSVAADADLLTRALHAWSLWRYLGRVHDAAGVDPDDYDARLYLWLRPAAAGMAPRFVEGSAEAGGEVGIVYADLGRETVDGVLIAAAHELLHLLGASDKYDERGHARAPEGLADPDRVPPLPQTHAELMAGEIPEAPGRGRAPWRLEEVRVGALTAAEIGWTR